MFWTYSGIVIRGESRAAATSKMECFVIIVNGWRPLTIITKHSILDGVEALDPPLVMNDSNDAVALFHIIISEYPQSNF